MEKQIEVLGSILNSNSKKNTVDFFSSKTKVKKTLTNKFFKIILGTFLTIQAFYICAAINQFKSNDNFYQKINLKTTQEQKNFYKSYIQGNYNSMETSFNSLAHSPNAMTNLMASWLLLEVMNKQSIPLEQRMRMAETVMSDAYYGYDLEKDISHDLFQCSTLDMTCSIFKNIYQKDLDIINKNTENSIAKNTEQINTWYNSQKKLLANIQPVKIQH